ncbi:MAG: serine/threonine protein kinase, partial [Solirubrobacterales bacterium]|nr:serine/threonine protein kinase [Solirubrobacterales bacterium]
MSSGEHRRTLAGRYQLGEVLGRGGMSTVYRATDLSLDRVVAVKVAMDPLLERDPVYAARFKREARAAAALNHPCVVTIYDAGADGATRYIVMECVEGQDLAHLLRDEGPLEPARAARIAEQVADALAAAHAAGIVHRDIKPGNIMVVGAGAPGLRPAGGGAPGMGSAGGGTSGMGPGESRERVKVLDFGIARTEDAVSLTQTASVLGTAPYMAPEQTMGNPADARSDIYSLGCVLYEMLTGKPPFMADVPAAVMHQHVRVAPRPPRELNPAIPPALDALVLQMLAKDPADRPQTAGEVRDRLANFEVETAPTKPLPAADAAIYAAAAAAEVPQMATVPQPATPAPVPTPSPTKPVPTTRALPPPRRRGRGGPFALLAVLAVLLLGAAVAYALAGGGT